jgi:cephalosporin hydroxylase
LRLSVDTDNRSLTVESAGHREVLDLFSAEAFEELSRLWITTGWGLKYTYGFTWLGRPIIQLPEDLVVIQEVIYRVKPDVVIETGVAHGGSLVFYAGIFKAIGHGRVIGVDIEIRPHNRVAIEQHLLSSMITLVEGDAVSPDTLATVRELLQPDDRVLVVLDSNHSKRHVLAELDAYSPLVSGDSYIIATDGVMEWLEGVPGSGEGWTTDNPKAAVEEWLRDHPEFVLEEPPPFLFNEGQVKTRVTHWPSAYLRRTALQPSETKSGKPIV